MSTKLPKQKLFLMNTPKTQFKVVTDTLASAVTSYIC